METLQVLLNQVLTFIPNLCGALFILICGYMIVRLVRNIVARLLGSIGIDQLSEKLQKIDLVSKSEVEIKISKIISQVLYYFLMLVVLVASTDVLGLEVVSNLVSGAIEYIPNLLAAIIILILGALLAEMLREITIVACRSFGVPASKMIGSIIFWFVFLSIMITALSQAKLETSFITANLSIILAGLVFAFAIAYGLAARPLMGGFLASFYNRGKFNVGDKIEIEGKTGVILAIDRASITLDSNGEYLIIPLSKMQTETIRIIDRVAGSDIYIENNNTQS